VNEGEVIYDALYDRGEELPHGCLSGSCGACRIEIVQGSENVQTAGLVEQNTIDALKEEFSTTHGAEFVNKTNIRLACRAKILGDIQIKPIK
jgi:ferredoxin